MSIDGEIIGWGDKVFDGIDFIVFEVNELEILFFIGICLVGLLIFFLLVGKWVVIVGLSGVGKSLLFNLLLGFLFYCGLLKVNNIELCELDL